MIRCERSKLGVSGSKGEVGRGKKVRGVEVGV